ncbi:MAG: sugar phosphate isomerase/epimerase [Verrucomicrobiales bacterium]|nr:sugar phosphate isomerase/epimerase [Verrucomicrobiales bacterium]
MNRRAFLQHTGAALAAGSLATTLASCATPRHTPSLPRLSTSSLLFKDLPLESACAEVAALGFEGLDIWSAYEGCPHLDDALQRLGGRGVRDLLATHRLELVAFSTYVGGYAKYASLLGAAGGGVAIQGSAGPCRPDELRTRMKSFFEGLKPLADLAGEHHSWLAIENHGQALLDGPDSFKAFVDLNPHPRVGLALAPYHLQALGASVPETIRIAGSQLLFFYAWQNAPDLQQLPGLGPTDFSPWLQALADIKHRRCVNVFMHGHHDLPTTRSALARSRAHLLASPGSALS